MADRQSSLTPLGVVMVGSGSDKTKARGGRLWLDCADVDLPHGEANLAQLAASRPWISPRGEMIRYRSSASSPCLCFSQPRYTAGRPSRA